ncbi:DUF502 domain-containing protein [Viridibacterium curvum]|uniref:DUF502 domain-containing protein n=1 Tax=Viridibacterium curvum TaxID=1101404 RepID=A0ABP9QQV2_9RHOO
MQRFLRSLSRTFLAGSLASLPLVLTVVLLGWAVGLARSLVGPGSLIGRLLSGIGVQIVDVENPVVTYAVGIAILLIGVLLLGLVVQTSLRQTFTQLVDRTVRRIPLIGTLYDATNHFVGMFDRDNKADVRAMAPVWCFFGGEGNTAVLALMPNPKPIRLGEHDYLTVLVPTAPVPVGGGLLFVRADWVRPAEISVETLTSVYLSMGLTSPVSK